jgi:hypothetical protein
MTRRCDLCEAPISLARLAAVPDTHLCRDCKATHDEPRDCKATHDEPRVTVAAPFLRPLLVEGSLADLEEMQAAARELGGIG